MNSATIVQKIWNYCSVLRTGGMIFGKAKMIAGDLAANAEKI